MPANDPFTGNTDWTDAYASQIEDHFVEARVEGDRRIPNKDKTKLFGADGEPLELRANRQNVYFNDNLRNLSYFPEWKEEQGSVRPKGGITKEKAIERIGGWAISIIEGIPLAPEQGQGKTFEKEVQINGQLKKITREQAEGGMNAAEQYWHLKKQQEEGLTVEEQIFYSMYYLRKNNIVLDDDRGTNYLCRILGNATASGAVPYAFWYRGDHRAYLGGDVAEVRFDRRGVRSSVRVHP